jgi:hypothetical protein
MVTVWRLTARDIRLMRGRFVALDALGLRADLGVPCRSGCRIVRGHFVGADAADPDLWDFCGDAATGQKGSLGTCRHRPTPGEMRKIRTEKRALNLRVRGSSPWRSLNWAFTNSVGIGQLGEHPYLPVVLSFELFRICQICPVFLPVLAPCSLGGGMLAAGIRADWSRPAI